MLSLRNCALVFACFTLGAGAQANAQNIPVNPCEHLYAGAHVGCNVANQVMVCVETAKGIFVAEPSTEETATGPNDAKCRADVRKRTPQLLRTPPTPPPVSKPKPPPTPYIKKQKSKKPVPAHSNTVVIPRCKGSACGVHNAPASVRTLSHAPLANKARCYALMNRWNAKRIAYNGGQCKLRVRGTPIDYQCQRLKAQLLAEREAISRQCRGVLQITPGN